MRRTQLYLDDHLWNALHARARASKTTISELAREALRERYVGPHEERKKAMQDFIGVRKGTAQSDTMKYVRRLRRGTRISQLQNE